MAYVDQDRIVILEGKSGQLLLEWLTFHKEFRVGRVEVTRLPLPKIYGPAKEFTVELIQYKEGFGWGHADRAAIEDLVNYINNS